jgi:hypothetical protein
MNFALTPEQEMEVPTGEDMNLSVDSTVSNVRPTTLMCERLIYISAEQTNYRGLLIWVSSVESSD